MGRFVARGATAGRWWVFGVTYTTYSIVYVTRKALSIVKTLIQEDLGLSTYMLGTIDSVFLSTYATFQIFLPSLSDRFGVRPVLVVALFSAGVLAVSFSLAGGPHGLILAWTLEGVAHAPIFSVLIKSVALWFPPPLRGKVLSVWTTSQQIGAIVATVLVTSVSAQFGWRAALLGAGLVTVTAALGVLLFLPERPPAVESVSAVVELQAVTTPTKIGIIKSKAPEAETKSSTSAGGSIVVVNREPEGSFSSQLAPLSAAESTADPAEARTPATTNSSAALSSVLRGARGAPTPPEESAAVLEQEEQVEPLRFMDVLRIPNLCGCGVAYFFVKLTRYALLFWLPFFLVTELHFAPSLAGYSSMVFDIGGIFGAIASGFIADKLLKGRRLTTAAMLCGATAASLVLFAWTACPNHRQRNALQSEAAPHLGLRGGSRPCSSRLRNDLGLGLPVDDERCSHGGDADSDALPSMRAGQLLLDGGSSTATQEKQVPTSYVWMLLLLGLVGFTIAGPDSILGAASAVDVCERSGDPAAAQSISAATGVVNGLGAFGGVAQGYVTAFVSEAWGWDALFMLLCAASIAAIAALWKSIVLDWRPQQPPPRYIAMMPKKNIMD